MYIQASDVIKNSNILFGTSGARGLVTHFTNEVCNAFTNAFVSCMKEQFHFNEIAVAVDNRPSSEFIAIACMKAIEQQGIKPIYYGVLPTPALAHSAMESNIPSIMVTGSHIPFDRNGLKFYRPDGEITKLDEQKIVNNNVIFNTAENSPTTIPITTSAADKYITRYTSLFDNTLLTGKRIGIYEHSSAGRDIYSIIFKTLGAEVISLGRSDTFVPIDTEAVSYDDKIKALDWSKQYDLDAIFSTDGDGDRPLVADENGNWLRGDILGLLCSLEMGIEAVATPISCNTSIYNHKQFACVKQTKIGSPYVIAELSNLSKSYTKVAGFEANGGFILQSNMVINNKPLSSLPTRDAILPFLILLAATKEQTISQRVKQLPQKFTSSGRIQNFTIDRSQFIIEQAQNDPVAFLQRLGFKNEQLLSINTIDGIRIILQSGNIIHLRASGNAPELRCYSEANSIEFAEFLVTHTLQTILSITD